MLAGAGRMRRPAPEHCGLAGLRRPWRGGLHSATYPQQLLQSYAVGGRRFRIESIARVDPGAHIALAHRGGNSAQRRPGSSGTERPGKLGDRAERQAAAQHRIESFYTSCYSLTHLPRRRGKRTGKSVAQRRLYLCTHRIGSYGMCAGALPGNPLFVNTRSINGMNEDHGQAP
jgi:hypothetical protein